MQLIPVTLGDAIARGASNFPLYTPNPFIP
ncbi:MAG: hypothetical protein JWR26_3408 [Pedosphaera sp.]|nr:hypothetical protein [Pedosphaera sp.]